MIVGGPFVLHYEKFVTECYNYSLSTAGLQNLTKTRFSKQFVYYRISRYVFYEVKTVTDRLNRVLTVSILKNSRLPTLECRNFVMCVHTLIFIVYDVA